MLSSYIWLASYKNIEMFKFEAKFSFSMGNLPIFLYKAFVGLPYMSFSFSIHWCGTSMKKPWTILPDSSTTYRIPYLYNVDIHEILCDRNVKENKNNETVFTANTVPLFPKEVEREKKNYSTSTIVQNKTYISNMQHWISRSNGRIRVLGCKVWENWVLAYIHTFIIIIVHWVLSITPRI